MRISTSAPPGWPRMRARQGRVRHLGDHLVELRFGDPLERAAKENLAGPHRVRRRAFAVDEPGQFERQFLVRVAAFRGRLVLRFQRGDVFHAGGT